LTDANGVPLHGAYERKVKYGYQTSIINNGRVLQRYVYDRPAPAPIPGDRHSYANLALCGGITWQVPADSEGRTYLQEDHVVMQRLLAGLKPCGSVVGSPEQVADWCAQAEAAGFVTRVVRSWPADKWSGPRALATLARSGPLLIGNEEQELFDAYDGQIGDWQLEDALDELRDMTGEHFLFRDWANPVTIQDSIITGHALGYPPTSTISFIGGTNS